MSLRLQALIIFLLILTVSCTPEDGFCIEETYRIKDGNSCSQLDDHFSQSGSGIEEKYTSRKALYDGSFVTVSGSDYVIIEKPSYIPAAIKMEKMTSCTIAPSTGGVDCKRWYSFYFLTADGNTVSISNRKGAEITENMALSYLTFETSGLVFEGYINSSKIGIYDISVIDSQKVEVIHKYTFEE